jgi:hypothetical protein
MISKRPSGRRKKEEVLDKPLSSSNQYRLSAEEEIWLAKYREQKTLLEKECISAGISPDQVKQYWYKSKMFSIFAGSKTKSLEDLKSEIISGMKQHSPKYPTIKKKKVGRDEDAYLLVIDPADIHIGKLGSKFETGEEYNVSKAVARVEEGIDGLLEKVSKFEIDKIVLILGNDILHTDNTRRTTTSGTPQDTDGQWYDNFLIAQKLYVSIIEKLMSIAPVHIMHNVSNHDYMTGWMLSETIRCWFRNVGWVTFDTTMRHRKAYQYHNNLIGATHGDGAKQDQLPILYAQEFKDMWAKTDNRYIYGGHVHHKTSKDYVGITYETSRSASGTDGWHHRNGYQHSTKAIEAYLHHKKQGQVARFTHKFI